MAAVAIPSGNSTQITPKTFSRLCDQIGFSDKLAKFIQGVMGFGKFGAERVGRQDCVASFDKGLQVLSIMRGGLKALEVVGDFSNFIGAIQDGESVDAILHAGAVISDGLDCFMTMKKAAGVKFAPALEKGLNLANDVTTVVSLSPLVARMIYVVCRDTSKAADYDQLAVDADTAGEHYMAALMKHEAAKLRTSTGSTIINIVEKTLTVALVVFGLIAAAFMVASVIGLPIILSLSVMAAAFAIWRACRGQFVKNTPPDPKDYGVSPQDVDAINNSDVVKSILDAAKAHKTNRALIEAAANKAGIAVHFGVDEVRALRENVAGRAILEAVVASPQATAEEIVVTAARTAGLHLVVATVTQMKENNLIKEALKAAVAGKSGKELIQAVAAAAGINVAFPVAV